MAGKNIEAGFQSVCKILFGREVGTLGEFEPYLKETLFHFSIFPSSKSGKEVFMSGNKALKGSTFLAQDETRINSARPLGINEIKDIDSLLARVRENSAFCGSKTFGRDLNTSHVDNCTDSTDSHFCHNIFQVKNSAYCSYVREADYVYGVSAFPYSRQCIRIVEGTYANRSFECYYASEISDCYFCMNCIATKSAMFSFNMRNKSYAIGNNQLDKGTYAKIRSHLLEQMADELEKKKRLFSIADLAAGFAPQSSHPVPVILPPSPVPAKIEKAWQQTAKVVLCAEHPGVEKYGQWLLGKNSSIEISRVKGADGKPTFMNNLPVVCGIPASRLLGLQAALDSAPKGISLDTKNMQSLKEVALECSRTAYFTHEFVTGVSQGAVDTPEVFNSTDVYRCWDCTESRLCAYSNGGFVRSSEYSFGGSSVRLLGCKFSIKCYDSSNLNRCLEVDSSHNCNDCYFCHNCESCEECLFCFNAKGLRHALFNTPLPKEEYARVKKILLGYLNSQLEKSASVPFDLFSISAGETARLGKA
ncbi:MAG: hypothetical protein WC506_05735 [Candidatus Micrarchaeia archaeon]